MLRVTVHSSALAVGRPNLREKIMSSTNKIVLGVAAAAFAASMAQADPYKDYTPAKGVWQVTTMKVDPNHIDDYLVGLKKSWVPGEEMAKKHGVIDEYFVMVNANGADPAGNILLGEHYVSFATMDPDRSRDMAMQKEALAQMSKDEDRKMTNGFDKYRSFMGETMWTPVSYGK
jgi:hypothetical protein